MKKKWRPTGESIEVWAAWFKNHLPICQVQEIGLVTTDPKRITEGVDNLWNKHRKHFQKHSLSKEDVRRIFREVIGELKIYPYKTREEDFDRDFQHRLVHMLAEKASEQTLIPLEETKENAEGEEIKTYHGPVAHPSEIEDRIIEEIEPDVEKLVEQIGLRETARRLGIPHSTLHDRLSKKRRKSKPKS